MFLLLFLFLIGIKADIPPDHSCSLSIPGSGNSECGNSGTTNETCSNTCCWADRDPGLPHCYNSSLTPSPTAFPTHVPTTLEPTHAPTTLIPTHIPTLIPTHVPTTHAPTTHAPTTFAPTTECGMKQYLFQGCIRDEESGLFLNPTLCLPLVQEVMNACGECF